MRAALMLPPDCALSEVTTHARRAEDAGVDALACGEHLFFHGATGNAFVMLAAAAAVTERLRLMSALTILPLYPVALAAKLVATLDGLSDGRFDLGVGVGVRGEYPPEFDAVAVPVTERGRRTDEALRMLAALSTGSPTHAEGRAGRHGSVWVPYLVTHEQLAAGMATARAAATEYGRAPVSGAVYCWSAVDHDRHRARRTAIDVVGRIYQQDFEPPAERYLLIGDPADLVARLCEYRDAGAESIVFAPACPPDEYLAMVRLFADEVLPELHDG